MASKDPLDWTLEDVVLQLCRSTRLFRDAGFLPHDLPEPVVLERQVRSRVITGRVLLNDLNERTVGDWFSILSSPQRSALLAVVHHLRFRSSKYPERQPVPNGNTGSGPQVPDITAPVLTSRPRNPPSLLQPMHTGPTPSSLSNGANGPPSNEWDYLLDRWNDEGAAVLSPIEVDGDDPENLEEEEDDESMGDDEEEQEAQEEPLQSEKGKRGRKVAQDEVVAIINDFISEYTEAWRPGLHADEEDGEEFDQAFDAHELWHELHAQPEEERRRVIEQTKANIDMYEVKLDKLCEAIIGQPWSLATAVKQQCSNLESTIDLLEQEKWELSVYEMRSPPPRIQWTDEVLPATVTTNRPMVRADRQEDFDHVQIVDRETPSRTQTRGVQAPGGQEAPETNRRPALVEIIDLGSDSDEDITEQTPPLPSDGHTHHDQAPSAVEDQLHSEPMVIDSIELECEPQSSEATSQSQKRRTKPPPMQITPPPPPSSVRPQDPPEEASYSTVSKWQWEDLVSSADRKRIVMKALQEMPSTDRELIRTRIHTVRKPNLLLEITACVAMLLRADNKIQGYLARDVVKIVKFTNLFLCWWLAGDYFSSGKEVPEWRLRELAACLAEGVEDPGIFCDWLRYVLDHTFSQEALDKLWAPSQAEIICISDDDETVVVQSVARTKHKRGRDEAAGT